MSTESLVIPKTQASQCAQYVAAEHNPYICLLYFMRKFLIRHAAQNKPQPTNQNPDSDVWNIGQPIRGALPERLKSPELNSCVNVFSEQKQQSPRVVVIFVLSLL